MAKMKAALGGIKKGPKGGGFKLSGDATKAGAFGKGASKKKA